MVIINVNFKKAFQYTDRPLVLDVAAFRVFDKNIFAKNVRIYKETKMLFNQ